MGSIENRFIRFLSLRFSLNFKVIDFAHCNFMECYDSFLNNTNYDNVFILSSKTLAINGVEVPIAFEYWSNSFIL